MKTITLPAGSEHVQFDELAHRIADAMWPSNGEDDERIDYAFTRIRFEDELSNAAKSGALPVKDAMTLGPHPYPVGRALQTALVSVNDLREFLAGRFIAVEVVPAQNTATPAPVVDAIPDLTLMATREQLIDAFGSFTGMDAAWFRNLKDTPALLAARKVTGQGGRGHIAVPLFCPFEVLQWVINPARRKGRMLGPDKGWELFERHFPRPYAEFSVGDPRTD